MNTLFALAFVYGNVLEERRCKAVGWQRVCIIQSEVFGALNDNVALLGLDVDNGLGIV